MQHNSQNIDISLDLIGDPFNSSAVPQGCGGCNHFRNVASATRRDSQCGSSKSQRPETPIAKSCSRKKLPSKMMAALAMMVSGFSDLDLIANATGMTLSEVQELERANDPRVLLIIAEGLPYGEHFRLRNSVKCPKCGGRIYLVPCLLCNSA